MRAALVAATLLAALGAVPAHAAVTAPGGQPCSFGVMTDDGGTTTTAELSAGPLTIVDEDDPSVVRAGRVTCSVHVGWPNHTHASPAAAAATGEVGAGVAVLAPTPVTFTRSVFDEVFLCTEVEIDGTTLYWHDPQNRNIENSWSTDPSSFCQHFLETADLRGDDPPWPTIATTGDLGDQAACPVYTADPALWAAVSQVWECDPRISALVAIERRSALGAVLRKAPYGWACTDATTGLAVTAGSALAVPDPGVACTPPGPAARCGRVYAAGVLAPTGFGRATVTSACGSLSAARTLGLVPGRSVGYWNWVYGYGETSTPWRCTVDEDVVSPADPAYLVLCGGGFG